MLDFKPISIEDREIITSYTLPSNYQNCDYSFANMCSWQFLYGSEYAILDECLIIRFHIPSGRLAYMFPLGKGDLKKILEVMEADSLEKGENLLLLGVTPEAQKDLESILPGQFHYISDRDYYDYIYLREDLVNLKGKKFQSKRNHINRFKSQYDYRLIPISHEIIPHCLELERKWFRANQETADIDELSNEYRSMRFALENYGDLGLKGSALVVDCEIIAFSFGAPINHNTFGIHVEKADISYEGVFSVINNEVVSKIPEKYTYINREEDLGIPGLRKAKLSYNPHILLEKNAVAKKNSPSD